MLPTTTRHDRIHPRTVATRANQTIRAITRATLVIRATARTFNHIRTRNAVDLAVAAVAGAGAGVAAAAAALVEVAVEADTAMTTIADATTSAIEGSTATTRSERG
jgi:hypothetical protein